MKIYVVYQDSWESEIGWIVGASLDKFTIVKHDIEKEHNQNSHMKIFDSETFKELYECDVLIQYTDKTRKCHCEDCKAKDETFRWCSTNGVGNFSK